MKRTASFICCFLLTANLFSQKGDFPNLSGPYLGQKPPGMMAEVFAPELRSTVQMQGFIFSPDGTELYFGSISGIMFSRQENDCWTKPQTASFSGRYRDFDLNFSPDGSQLWFTSNRPLEKDGAPQGHYDIWFVQRTDTGWTEPTNIGLPINTEQNEVHPSISENGNLYFFRDIRGGAESNADIYCSKYADGRYAEPLELGNEINSESADIDPFIAPDESYLIFHSFRQGEYGGIDLYISFRKNDGSWTQALNMGEKINTTGNDRSGKISLDGKYFFFTRANIQTRKREDYWISAKIIEELRRNK